MQEVFKNFQFGGDSLLKQQKKEKYLLAFGLGFFCLLIVLLPLIIIDHGYFIYYGDFVSQQLPFYQLANDAVRNQGLLGWNWYTDLGSSFLGSYAFYLTGSPFFWLTVLLPEKLVLYAIPWLLCLKHGIASLTAYGYIRYFVKNQNIAVIGGLLYAFSGFQIFNLFFNHFQDVTAFFPLMLIAMEEYLRNHRKGCFALSVTLMAVINYFFFTGQAVFLIIYFLVRLCCKDIIITWKNFFILLLEAILGVCIACVVLLPAGLAVLDNSRVSEYLFGQDMLLYHDKTKIIRIIQSFFMIPDAPARTNLFSSDYSKWASIGGYLPLFSMAGVIAFINHRKKHWASILIYICMLCAFVPVLNSMFYLFNASYYARWFYMPVLIMAMMTAHALDNIEINFKTGLLTSGIMLILFGIISVLPVKQDDEIKFFAFASIPVYFWITLAVSVICLAGAEYICKLRKQKQKFQNQAILLTSVACVACTCTIVYFGKAIGTNAENYIHTAIHGKENLSISYEADEEDYFRIDISENYDNYPMFWGLSNMRCFQSVVSPSIMEFYHSIGINRDVASRAETEYYTLRGLFSVKYYFQKTDEEQTKELDLAGFAYDRTENGFAIYKNNYFIPMGFTFENYILEENLENTEKLAKERMLIQALILNQEQAELYSDIMTEIENPENLDLSKDQYLKFCEAHANEACENFNYNANGFSASINLEQPKLVFFSVPYEKGWTAKINHQPVAIEKVSNGFMAVRCETGENEIVFSYELTGLKTGALITLIGILLFILYCVLPIGKNQKKTIKNISYLSVDGVRASKAYIQYLQNKNLNHLKGEYQHDKSSE